jgi:uncharacterized phage protein (TIGR02220 family)
MDWSEERYARMYLRDTADLLAFGYEGRAVWWELIRKVDRAGVLHHGGDLDIVADLLRMPVEFFRIGIEKIAKRGSAKLTKDAVVIPNYMPANEAGKSDRVRQQESRERRRTLAMTESHGVTDGHDSSQAVTKCHSVPSLAVPFLAEPSERRDVSADEPQTSPASSGTERPKRRRAGMAGAAPEEQAAVDRVLAKLNERSGRSYGAKAHGERVLRLLRSGHTETDLRTVIWDRANRWAGDEKMDEFLRPATVFGPQKFPDYLAAAQAAWDEHERDGHAVAAKRAELSAVPWLTEETA